MAGQQAVLSLVARPGTEKALWAHELVIRASMAGREVVWLDPKGTRRADAPQGRRGPSAGASWSPELLTRAGVEGREIA